MLTKAVHSIRRHEEAFRTRTFISSGKVSTSVRANRPCRVTLIYVISKVVKSEAFQVWCLIGAIGVEVEVSKASQTGHWKVADKVVAFLARGIATCVKALIELYVV